MTESYDMNDTATLAHDPYVSEYGDGYGGAYGTGYDTDHGSQHMEGAAFDDGRAVGGTYGGGFGSADGYTSDYDTRFDVGGTYGADQGYGTSTYGSGYEPDRDMDKDGSTTSDDGAQPSIGDRVDNALDGMRNTFNNVVGTVKEKFADDGWERAEQAVDNNTNDDDTITYNQIHEAVPDPSYAAKGSYGDSMGTVSEDCGAVSGRACGSRQGSDYDVDGNVAQMNHDISSSAWSEDEI